MIGFRVLYILVKHNHKFMEGLGKYAMVKGNHALRQAVWGKHFSEFCQAPVMSGHTYP